MLNYCLFCGDAGDRQQETYNTTVPGTHYLELLFVIPFLCNVLCFSRPNLRIISRSLHLLALYRTLVLQTTLMKNITATSPFSSCGLMP